MDQQSSENSEWKSFVWSQDRDNSYESFVECLTDWEMKAQADSSIDVAALFNFESSPPDVKHKNDLEQQYWMDLKNVNMYAHIEDLFECSGMCRPSLFYFGLPLTMGYPEETCIHHFKEYLDSSAGNFAKASVLTGLIFLFIFFMHFGLYCRDKDHLEEK